MKRTYITPEIHIVTEDLECDFMSGSGKQEGGVIATAPDMEGEMNCPCGGDPNKCTCGDDCDCWGCKW